MHNVLKTIGITIVSLFIAGNIYAAGALSIPRIEHPRTPTNLTEFNINFVVLDYTANGAITAQCFYNKDGGVFTQFGSNIAIDQGGGTANCVTNSSIITGDGTYQFYVIASNTDGPVTSETVTVLRNTSGPDTPTSYSKEDFESCKYKIKFRTANDSKTTKVELYRSPNTTFDVNSGSLIATQSIGPDTEGEFTTDKPDCGTTYYYVIRAFDAVGNGSGIRGDSETHTKTTTILPTTTTGGGVSGAIPAGTGGNILGVETPNDATEASGAILGEETTPTQETYIPPVPRLFSRTLLLTVGAIAVILLGIWLAKRKRSE